MRVLAVGNMYPPHHFGGYELVWRSAVEHLRARGHAVRVLTTDTRTATAEPDDPEVHRELNWHLQGGEFAPQTPLERWRMARHNHRTLERHLAAFEPEAVMWWSMGGLSLTMLETVRRRGLPAVAFVHDEWLDYGRWVDGWLRSFMGPRRGRLAPLAERVSGIPASVRFGEAAEYVFVSEHVRGSARLLDLDLQRTSVAHSGIHPDFLSPAASRRWGWQLLYVGRLDARKGVDTAIEALSFAPEAVLTIAGGWDEREAQRLRDLARSNGVADRVVFAGHCDRAALMRLYEECDAVVFPVRWEEPWGLVPLEAMARGRPVVATGRGGSGEYLRDGVNCLLAEADDPEALARAVGRLADDAVRARLVEGGFETAPNHTEAHLNAAVEAALERAVGAPPPPGAVPRRVLHIGSGFRPMRSGGLVAYVEDLMDEQVRSGAEVTYLFTGRYFPWMSGPRLRRWRRRGVRMLEIVSSPLYDHGFQPRLELEHAGLEAVVRRALAEAQPDVVHIHELAGFPTSVLDVVRDGGRPTVMTLQDYFPLCPSFKLIDADGGVCLRREVGSDCVATMAADNRPANLLHYSTLRYEIAHRRVLRRLLRRERIAHDVATWATRNVRRRSEDGGADASAFQRRRDVTVERLNRLDRVVAMSTRVGEIYATLGVDEERIVTQPLTLAHISGLRPRHASGRAPVVFATLGGGESRAKGADLLLAATRQLDDLILAGRMRLIIFGTVEASVAAAAAELEGVELPGRYAPDRQDALLDGVDVGIIPSVWEEAYAYAGIEFLAKGIPVIANAIGGMVDYVRDGETGWLNHDCSADGLARLMRTVAEQPELVVEMNRRLRERRGDIVLSMPSHAASVDALYDEIAAVPLT